MNIHTKRFLLCVLFLTAASFIYNSHINKNFRDSDAVYVETQNVAEEDKALGASSNLDDDSLKEAVNEEDEISDIGKSENPAEKVKQPEVVSSPEVVSKGTAQNDPVVSVPVEPKPPTPVPVVPKKEPVPPEPEIPVTAPVEEEKDESCQSGGFNAQFLCLINAHRSVNGKGALVYDGLLNEAAEKHSVWMAENQTMSHTGENGSQFYGRCQAVGTSCNAENVAYGFNSAQVLFDMWKNSAGHNANMLGNYKRLGLGIFGKYATNNFGI